MISSKSISNGLSVTSFDAFSHLKNHRLSRKMMPGKRPASVIPKKKRETKRPAVEVTAAIQHITIPQATMTIGIHFEGPIFLSIKLDGISNRICGAEVQLLSKNHTCS
jgi:hypothetical protein